MAVYKEEKTETWRAVYRYTDWNGERKQTQKRGFKTCLLYTSPSPRD